MMLDWRIEEFCVGEGTNQTFRNDKSFTQSISCSFNYSLQNYTKEEFLSCISFSMNFLILLLNQALIYNQNDLQCYQSCLLWVIYPKSFTRKKVQLFCTNQTFNFLFNNHEEHLFWKKSNLRREANLRLHNSFNLYVIEKKYFLTVNAKQL